MSSVYSGKAVPFATTTTMTFRWMTSRRDTCHLKTLVVVGGLQHRPRGFVHKRIFPLPKLCAKSLAMFKQMQQKVCGSDLRFNCPARLFSFGRKEPHARLASSSKRAASRTGNISIVPVVLSAKRKKTNTRRRHTSCTINRTFQQLLFFADRMGTDLFEQA